MSDSSRTRSGAGWRYGCRRRHGRPRRRRRFSAAEQVLYTARSNLRTLLGQRRNRARCWNRASPKRNTRDQGDAHENEKDPHSTVVMLLLQPGKVGLVHCRRQPPVPFSRRPTSFRTTDHSYVEHLIAEGKITPEQALVHPNQNILLTSMGGGEPPKIAYGESDDPLGGDSFLLCSDGLWGWLFDDAELAGVVAAFRRARRPAFSSTARAAGLRARATTSRWRS